MFDFLTSGRERAANVLPYFNKTADSKILPSKRTKECPSNKKDTVPNQINYIYKHSDLSLNNRTVNKTLFPFWQSLKLVCLGKKRSRKGSFFTNSTLASAFSGGKENDTHTHFLLKIIYTHKRQEVKKVTSMIPIISRAEGDPFFPLPVKVKIIPHYIFQEPTSTITNTYSVGRLATYNFCNMDRKVAQALTTIKKIMHEQPEDDVIRKKRNILFS